LPLGIGVVVIFAFFGVLGVGGVLAVGGVGGSVAGIVGGTFGICAFRDVGGVVTGVVVVAGVGDVVMTYKLLIFVVGMLYVESNPCQFAWFT